MTTIKNLINKDTWDKCVKNNDDGYSKACVNITRNVMNYLDDNPTEFSIGYYPDMSTPHGIICHCDDQGGITGFQAGSARNMIAVCYKDGWKFWLADTISPLEIDDKETISKRIDTLCKTMENNDLEINKEEIEQYAHNLIERSKQ